MVVGGGLPCGAHNFLLGQRRAAARLDPELERLQACKPKSGGKNGAAPALSVSTLSAFSPLRLLLVLLGLVVKGRRLSFGSAHLSDPSGIAHGAYSNDLVPPVYLSADLPENSPTFPLFTASHVEHGEMIILCGNRPLASFLRRD